MNFQPFCLAVVVAAMSVHIPVAAGPQATAQKPAQGQQKSQPKVSAVDLGVDLERIQRALANTPRLRFDAENRPVFRVQVFGEKPTIDDILGPDWATGPVPHGSMSHQEFLAMVTPTEMQGYGGFTNKEGVTVAATSFALQWTLQKAIRKFHESQDQREREAARKEVLDALNALEQARAKARGR